VISGLLPHKAVHESPAMLMLELRDGQLVRHCIGRV
jgi:hypothetical protein